MAAGQAVPSAAAEPREISVYGPPIRVLKIAESAFGKTRRPPIGRTRFEYRPGGSESIQQGRKTAAPDGGRPVQGDPIVQVIGGAAPG